MKNITPTELAKTAQEFAPIFKEDNKDGWEQICRLIACQVADEYKVDKDRIRVFLLNVNRGGNETEDSKWPVVARNTKEGVRDAELAISRTELRSIVQDFEDIKDRFQRASGSVRVSSSTKTNTSYGTSGVDTLGFGTLSYVLKIAVKTTY